MAEIAATTNIHDLPMGGSSTRDGPNMNNVQLHTEELVQQPQSAAVPEQPSMSLDQGTINQIINGLHQASSTGATQLASRDIPQATDQLTGDKEVQPNYVPEPEKVSYIEDEDMLQHNTSSSLISPDTFYMSDDVLQTPIIISVLYFLFQLPVIKQTLGRFAAFSLNRDGNYSLYGLLFTSALFGSTYHVITSVIAKFSTF